MIEAIKRWKLMHDPGKGNWVIACGFERFACMAVYNNALIDTFTFSTEEKAQECIEWLKKQGYLSKTENRNGNVYIVGWKKE